MLAILVKTSRVQIDAVTQVENPGCTGNAATCITFIDPDGNPALLNDRPPLILEATVDAGTLNPRKVFIINNHTRSFIDVELVDWRWTTRPRQAQGTGRVSCGPAAGSANQQSGRSGHLDRRLQRLSIQRWLHRSDFSDQRNADSR